MHESEALRSLAHAMGVQTHFKDGLGRPIEVSSETLLSVCKSLGAQINSPSDAVEAMRHREAEKTAEFLPLVLVAWEGKLPSLENSNNGIVRAEIFFEDGEVAPTNIKNGKIDAAQTLPFGYHQLQVESTAGVQTCKIISAPVRAWRHSDSAKSWGVGTHLAALRSQRSRSLGDLRDLETFCDWVGSHGGNLVTMLPLLPTFNQAPAEPSPYSSVSRLFWSELILDLGDSNQPVDSPSLLDVPSADVEVRAALAGLKIPDPELLDEELKRYARFRGAQARLGRDWRSWNVGPRNGSFAATEVDPDEERFHLVAQTMVRNQLDELRQRLDRMDVRLGLDLAVGVHPDGYDPWSRQALFANGMSVGAPPDAGFPSGQDWGFAPVLPEASRREGHDYMARSIAHQAKLSGVLRIDHIMAVTRLYWIPHGAGLHEGTYVKYPAEELFAIITLESHRNECEMVGENLGTVPPEIDEALPRHRIWGTYLAEFEAGEPREELVPPTMGDVALIGTHDTPPFAGWLKGTDIDERVRSGLLREDAVPAERQARAHSVEKLATALAGGSDDPDDLLGKLLEWLGKSDSPLVIPWIEDLWLEERQVNLPGTRSSDRANWQRPMARLSDDIVNDPKVETMVRRLDEARNTD